MPTRRQAIIWTNDGLPLYHIEHMYHQYWITNTKQACMGSDAICVPYLLLLLPSGFDLITEPEVLIGVWSRAHPVCDRAALSVDREITTRGSGKVACKGDPPSMALFTWKQATSNGSWCIGIKGEMSGTVCVTFTWDIYIYIWVVYSFCLFCCLFIIVTWWYMWCIVWQVASKRKYRHVW